MIVIFDLDGTVWDSVEGIVGSLEHTFGELGLPVPAREVLSANVGPPLQQMLADLGVPAPRLAEATAAYRARYISWGVHRASVYPGVEGLLDELGRDGRRLATATSKGEDPARVMLDGLGLLDRFEVVAAASMTELNQATKTAVIARALAGLGDPSPRDCLMVGDRHYDVTGSAQFGIDCIGVEWGYGSRGELDDAGAWRVVGSTDELLDAVREWVADR